MKTPKILYYSTRLCILCIMVGTLFVLGGCWGEPRDDIGSSLYSITSILLDPDGCSVNVLTNQVDCTTIYVATSGGGIYKSPDGGASWQQSVNGLFEWNITEMVMDPKNPSVLYAGTENNGLFRSTDKGVNWALAGNDASMIKAITSIAVDANTCQSGFCSDIYVGTEEDGIWYGKDFGLIWARQNDGLPVPAIVTALTVFSYSVFPSTLYAGTEEGHIYKWDYGTTRWKETPPGLSDATNARPLVIAVNPIVPSEIFVGTSGGEAQTSGGTFRTIDGGANWAQVLIPKAENFSVRELVFCIKIKRQCAPTFLTLDTDNSDPLVEEDILYAGVYGLSRSFTIMGDFWDNINLNDEIEAGNNVSSLAIDSLRHTTLYAGTLVGFIMKSQDSGTTWERIDINF